MQLVLEVGSDGGQKCQKLERSEVTEVKSIRSHKLTRCLHNAYIIRYDLPIEVEFPLI